MTLEPPDPATSPEEEPVVTGTLFLTTIMLALITGFWVTIYIRLLHS
jgi:hypothetical protein